MLIGGCFEVMGVKIWVFALIMAFLSPQLVFSVYSMDRKTIAEAQEYGIKSISKSESEFYYSWLSFEEQAEIIDETTEYAHFYTPFLLVASEARIKALRKEPVEIISGEKVVDDYKGYFVFTAVLKGETPDFASKAKANLRQDKLNRSGEITASNVQKYEKNGKTYYMATFYFYFKSDKYSLTKPAFLNISMKNKQERRFYFDFGKLK
jgi:hypothetical protein